MKEAEEAINSIDPLFFDELGYAKEILKKSDIVEVIALALDQRERETWRDAGAVMEKRETWNYAGGGGIDTEHWCKRGVCFTIPGIKQIVTYGIKNDAWWTKYLFLWQVLKPKKYFADGWNAARSALLSEAERRGMGNGPENKE